MTLKRHAFATFVLAMERQVPSRTTEEAKKTLTEFLR